ncbi:glycosyltransferase family 4 protein [Afifella pfennigii]|uniref:glycosyltransferase family 4 protein n=1 Tax=Afifella pfennigii TaxID=209897 RepID=UPI00047B202B|nr:glycosyltransferase family 4 protein [Afifella pfennigii]
MARAGRSLVLFTEFGATIERGQRFGLLLRNMAIYERLIADGTFDDVYWFMYGRDDPQDLQALQEKGEVHPRLHVLAPPASWRGPFSALFYSLLGPLVHRKVLARATAYKTAQVTGSWTALIAKALFRRPLLFRLGYPLSVRFRSENATLKYWLASVIEFLLVRFSDMTVVSSSVMQGYYRRYSSKAQINLLPSYIDMAHCDPVQAYSRDLPILYVGRLEPVKNIEALIRASAKLDVEVDLYGRGSLDEELRALAKREAARVNFKGVVPNHELLALYSRYTFCVLCSTREGMPKSLIEAMGAGLICICTPTDGACELITDGVTGYLTEGFDAEAIAERLSWVLENFDPQVGRRAREAMLSRSSLESAAELERSYFEAIVGEPLTPSDSLVHEH